MITERPFRDKVTVVFVKRDDGGLQARCDAIPGFYLSGKDPRAVMRDVVPAIESLVRHNQGIDVDVFPLKNAVYELRERMQQASDAIPDQLEYVIEPKNAA